MTNISRRKFLKITGTGLAVSVLPCGCVSRNDADTTSEKVPPSNIDVTMKAEDFKPTILYPDRVAYICGCKPDMHNPGSGGDNKLFIGNYCKNSERFLLHWDLSTLSPEKKITKAVMALYCAKIHGSPSGSIKYAPLNSDWGDNVTYNNQPTHDANKLVSVDWPAEKRWQEVDITDIVKQWLENPNINFGLIGYSVDVKDETCSAIFASIKTSDELRPRLIIT